MTRTEGQWTGNKIVILAGQQRDGSAAIEISIDLDRLTPQFRRVLSSKHGRSVLGSGAVVIKKL